jgi:putative DNA primase/helicase
VWGPLVHSSLSLQALVLRKREQTMKIEEILAQLVRVSKTDNGWQARCPAHDDVKPSLSIGIDNGKTLLCCHAGCKTEDVVQAMGLSMRDLFPDKTGERTVVAKCPYFDENGTFLFEVVRYEPKDFKVRQLVEDRWVYSMEGIKRVPYRLPEILNCKKVFVTEGEKDSDVGWRDLEVYTTTAPFGAGKWRLEYNAYFAGKIVRLIPDKDEEGRKHMQAVACSLFPVAQKVKIIELPFGKDLAEWHALGGTRDQLIKLAKTTPVVTAEQVQQWQTSDVAETGLRMKSLREMMDEPKEKVRWIVEGLCRAGGTTLLAAKPKVGKSTTARCIVFAVARGKKFLGRKTLQGPVLYLAPQEIKSEVTAHFEKLGATGDEPIHSCFVITSEFRISKLQESIEKYKPVLVVMDQLLHFLNVRDESKYAEVTKALQPIEALARKFGTVHILMTYHAGKSAKPDAGDDPLGSTAFFGAVDTLLVLKRFPNYRTLQSRQRYKDEHGDLAEAILQFDEASGAISLGAPRGEVEAERIAAEILEFLRQRQTKWFREETILANVEGGHAFKRKALRHLHRTKQIERSGRGRRGHPYLYSIQ